MPSLNVSSSRAPDSKRSMVESHSVAFAQASRIQSPTRNRSAKAMSESQKLFQMFSAMAVAVVQSPVRMAHIQRNRDTSVSTPRTTLAITVATSSSPQERTPPRISPRPRASEAAPLTSEPNTRPINSPRESKSSRTLRMAGVSAVTAPSKFSPSQIPAKNSRIRCTTRATVVTTPTSPAA